jgi:ferrous iron transport protein B
VLTVFFLFFGFMEDVGYLPNLGILARRMLARMGLSGKSIMPLILGFGCKTMATLTVRNITSKKERFIATYLIAFAIPCSAQLGLIMAILGKSGFVSLVIYFAFLILLEVSAGIILNKILKDEEKAQLVQELPSFRIPAVKPLLLKTWNRLVWFLKEATPVFVIAALAIFFMDFSGLLGMLKIFFKPIIVGLLGLPIEMVDALLLTLTRTEIGAGYILKLSDAGMLGFVQSLVAVVLATTFIPCSAHIGAMIKERGIRMVLVILSLIGVSSFVIAWVLRMFLELFV